VIAGGSLKVEQRRLRKLLGGKTIKQIWRRTENELVIIFVGGAHLTVDGLKDGALEFSVTGGTED
jgi:hypothetical protein